MDFNMGNFVLNLCNFSLRLVLEPLWWIPNLTLEGGNPVGQVISLIIDTCLLVHGNLEYHMTYLYQRLCEPQHSCLNEPFLQASKSFLPQPQENQTSQAGHIFPCTRMS